LIITAGCPPSITATTEFLVPRSIPTAFAIIESSLKSFSRLLPREPAS
jgi:hypothetical protein